MQTPRLLHMIILLGNAYLHNLRYLLMSLLRSSGALFTRKSTSGMQSNITTVKGSTV